MFLFGLFATTTEKKVFTERINQFPVPSEKCQRELNQEGW